MQLSGRAVGPSLQLGGFSPGLLRPARSTASPGSDASSSAHQQQENKIPQKRFRSSWDAREKEVQGGGDYLYELGRGDLNINVDHGNLQSTQW